MEVQSKNVIKEAGVSPPFTIKKASILLYLYDHSKCISETPPPPWLCFRMNSKTFHRQFFCLQLTDAIT